MSPEEVKTASKEMQFITSTFGRRQDTDESLRNDKRWKKSFVDFTAMFEKPYFDLDFQAYRTKENDTYIPDEYTEVDRYMDDPDNKGTFLSGKGLKLVPKKILSKVFESNNSLEPGQMRRISTLLEFTHSFIDNLPLIKEATNTIVHIDNIYFKLIYIAEIDQLVFKAKKNVVNHDLSTRSSDIVNDSNKLIVPKLETIEQAMLYVNRDLWHRHDSAAQSKKANLALNTYVYRLKKVREKWHPLGSPDYLTNYENHSNKVTYRVSPHFEALLLMCFGMTRKIKQERTKRLLCFLIYANSYQHAQSIINKPHETVIRRTNIKRHAILRQRAANAPRELTKRVARDMQRVINKECKLADLRGNIDYWIILNAMFVHLIKGNVVIDDRRTVSERIALAPYMHALIKYIMPTSLYYRKKGYTIQDGPKNMRIKDPEVTMSKNHKDRDRALKKYYPLYKLGLWYTSEGKTRLHKNLFKIHGRLV